MSRLRYKHPLQRCQVCRRENRNIKKKIQENPGKCEQRAAKRRVGEGYERGGVPCLIGGSGGPPPENF